MIGSPSRSHYVAFVKKQIPSREGNGTGTETDTGTGSEALWVLFNDEKVVRAADVEEMKKFAYIYFFRRQDQ